MKANRSELYHFLAEALSEPPDWLALPGREWPLTRAAAQVSWQSLATREALAAAVKSLDAVQPGSLQERQERYQGLFISSASSGLWLNEAGALNGRMLGDETWQVERCYQAAGLEIPGVELPDHASLELEFLAHLSASGQANFNQAENAFLKQHAARWLPQLGARLAKSGDPVYAPVGQMLCSWMELIMSNPSAQPHANLQRSPHVGSACTLCMACLAACPREVLRVKESPEVTRLVLVAADCNGCGVCARHCENGALRMVEAVDRAAQGWQVLFESPRDACIRCGAPLVSRAELNYVSAILDHPAWLRLCPDCR